ncbi:MAG: hypothetical protein LBK99_12525 [Opitutaceae bacterium]|jgi:hypothetical protein|nr:hypothetical protein [Opitutaceae bacterium]
MNTKHPTLAQEHRLLSSDARWIRDDTGPGKTGQYNLRARREFSITSGLLEKIRLHGGARLRITAESYYQVWINDHVLGHGPAKSPEGERFVDTFDLSPPDLLREGNNRLDVLVHVLGAGTMNAACPDEAGLLFQIELPDGSIIPSDTVTLVQRDPQRLKRTVRRWIMPCIEDVDANADVARASSPCCHFLAPRVHYRKTHDKTSAPPRAAPFTNAHLSRPRHRVRRSAVSRLLLHVPDKTLPRR